METFAEVRQHILTNHKLFIDEPFQLAFDCPMDGGERKQAVYIAELKASDNRRYLRVETLICPLADFDAEKCLRINHIQRVGYLAVGDLDGTAYIKFCENMPYRTLNGDELDYVIGQIAPLADRFEEILEGDSDIS